MRLFVVLVVVVLVALAFARVGVEALAQVLAPCTTDSDCARRHGGDGGPGD